MELRQNALRSSRDIYVVDFNKWQLVGKPHETVEDALEFIENGGEVKLDHKTCVGIMQLIGQPDLSFIPPRPIKHRKRQK